MKTAILAGLLLLAACTRTVDIASQIDTQKYADTYQDAKAATNLTTTLELGEETTTIIGAWDETIVDGPAPVDAGTAAVPIPRVLHHPAITLIERAPSREVTAATSSSDTATEKRVVAASQDKHTKDTRTSVAGMTWLWIALAVAGGVLVIYKLRSFIPILKLLP